MIDFPTPDNQASSAEGLWAKSLANATAFVSAWKNHKRIQPAFGPHAPYTVSAAHLQQVQKLADEWEVPIHIHVAETEKENSLTQASFAHKEVSPVQYLKKLGLLSDRSIFAHVVWASEADMKNLAEAGTGVVHCPQSNLKLASGIADIPFMLQQGVMVGLGTDGAASNNDLILWEEMNLVSMLHKGKNLDPTLMDAEKAFRLATIEGARAIHMDQSIGSIEVGKKADIVIVGTQSPHQIPPSSNIYSQLVYATKASDVETVIIDGLLVMEKKKIQTLDQKKVFQKAHEIRSSIAKSFDIKQP